MYVSDFILVFRQVSLWFFLKGFSIRQHYYFLKIEWGLVKPNVSASGTYRGLAAVKTLGVCVCVCVCVCVLALPARPLFLLPLYLSSHSGRSHLQIMASPGVLALFASQRKNSILVSVTVLTLSVKKSKTTGHNSSILHLFQTLTTVRAFWSSLQMVKLMLSFVI